VYRTVECELWLDPRVIRLSPDGRLLLLNLRTGSSSHFSGLYQVPYVLLAHETGLPAARLKRACSELTAGDFAVFDHDNGAVFVRRMFRAQGGENPSPKLMQAATKHLETIHSRSLIGLFLREYALLKIPYRYPIDTPTGDGNGAVIGRSSDPDTVRPRSSVRSLKSPVDDPAFARFYSAYPRHEHRGEALRAWQNLRPKPDLVERILADLPERRANNWCGRPTEKIPLPASYLNGAHWEDDLIAPDSFPEEARPANGAAMVG
jgi:hypothetical protein